MNQNPFTEKDNLFIGGIVAVIFSFLVFCIPLITNVPVDGGFGVFLVNFGVVWIYLIPVLVDGRLRKGRNGLKIVFILLVLSLISCYSLNREMGVFDESTTWLIMTLVVACINYLGFGFYESVPKWLQNLMLFIAGLGSLLFLYMAIYLAPTYILGVVGLIVLGVSYHVFVPVLFVIFTVKLIRKLASEHRRVWWYFLGGLGTSVLIVVVHTILWANTVRSLNEVNRVKSIEGSVGLPGWINVAQKLPMNGLAEKVLKTGIVYSIPKASYADGFWNLSVNRWNDEKVYHDPLIVSATFFTGTLNLSFDDKIQVLEAVYDARHQSEERLWTAANLVTDQVDTRVDCWPQFGLAYTEKQLIVTNRENSNRSWSNSEEAIYTFELPEGAVVSSLSLWVNGKEEKGVLTSMKKADSTYKQIVGVQRRDPSVVHWREGNRVAVRVFPVVSGESSMFKIGITAPLERANGKLLYQNIQFKGPDFSNAKETVSLHAQSTSQQLFVPAVFEKTTGEVRTNKPYQPNWSITMNEEPVSTAKFSFDGNNYSIRPYAIQREATRFQSIYLDINQSWTKQEFEQVWKSVSSKEVYVYEREFILLTKDNYLHFFKKLTSNRFSLFPFHQIKDPNSSLVITKNAGFSPNLSDIEGSGFLDSLKKSVINRDNTYYLFSLNQHLGSYLKTLKEYRMFRYETGTPSLLTELLSTEKFASNIENDQQVVLDNAGLIINAEPGNDASTAPDHLMRLFCYNHILQQQGRTMFSNEPVNDQLVKVAQRANIVTPVSSLIVLETQADYDRFNITNDEKSLKNAAAKGTGAAPEPHEWALILLGALIIAKLRFPFLFQRKAA